MRLFKKKTVQQTLFKSLDNIKKASIKMSKSWGINAISIPVLKEVINNTIKNNIASTKQGDNKYKIFINNYNNTLIQLLSTCRKAAKERGVVYVSFEFFDKCITTIKEWNS